MNSQRRSAAYLLSALAFSGEEVSKIEVGLFIGGGTCALGRYLRWGGIYRGATSDGALLIGSAPRVAARTEGRHPQNGKNPRSTIRVQGKCLTKGRYQSRVRYIGTSENGADKSGKSQWNRNPVTSGEPRLPVLCRAQCYSLHR